MHRLIPSQPILLAYLCVLPLLLSGADRGFGVRAQSAGLRDYDPSTFHALVVGIDEYAHWPDLRCAVNDAEAVAAVLRDSYGFGEITLLLNTKATKKAILTRLDSYLDLDETQSLLIYFAGHGWMDERTNTGYWVPVKAQEEAKFEYLANSLVFGDYLRKYRVKHLLVIADTCFSGTMLRRGEYRRPEHSTLPSMYRKPSRWALVSGDLAPVPDGAGAGHSPFATRLLQYLKYGDENVFGVTDLKNFIARSLPESDVQGGEFKVDEHMQGGEFVFCRLEERQPVLPDPVIADVTPIVSTGELLLTCRVSGVLSIDGKDLGRVASGKQYRLNKVVSGSRAVRVACADGTAWSALVDVPADGTADAEATVPRKRPKPAPAPAPVKSSNPTSGNVLSMAFVEVPAGSFQMGSEDGSDNEKPVHAVRISQRFWLGKYEVTQAEYETLMGTNPSKFKDARNPVETVSWDDATAFCVKLTEAERSAGRLPEGYEYRLPTEAEWEYAARGGPRSKGFIYAGSNELDDVAWHYGNSGERRLDASDWKTKELSENKCRAHCVGEKRGNELGLQDMSGNVYEWCLDWYDSDYYKASPGVDPVNAEKASSRVTRGGGWGSQPVNCRVAFRVRYWPVFTGSYLGFRVCLAHSVR